MVSVRKILAAVAVLGVSAVLVITGAGAAVAVPVRQVISGDSASGRPVDFAGALMDPEPVPGASAELGESPTAATLESGGPAGAAPTSALTWQGMLGAITLITLAAGMIIARRRHSFR